MHPNAKTNKKTRAYIQKTNKPVNELALELGVSRATVRKWKNRDDTEDKSHATNNLHTALGSKEEMVLIFLRNLLQLSIDDMLLLSHKFVNSSVSRSSLGRLVKRIDKNNVNLKKGELLNKEMPKHCVKCIIIHSNYLNPDFIYILRIETKSKSMHINWIKKHSTTQLIYKLSNFFDKEEYGTIFLASQSYNHDFHFNVLQEIAIQRNMFISSYSEKALENISAELLSDALLSLSKKMTNTRVIDINAVLRFFQVTYNFKMSLSSLRKLTPADKLKTMQMEAEQVNVSLL